MNVANLELCKELYELSGWLKGTEKFWFEPGDGFKNQLINKKFKPNGFNENGRFPAYDLGYLLRKLPGVKLEQIDKDFWNAQKSYNDGTELPDYKSCDGSTPEDAVCKLAIELFKQGILE